jgi:hypothetical protein
MGIWKARSSELRGGSSEEPKQCFESTISQAADFRFSCLYSPPCMGILVFRRSKTCNPRSRDDLIIADSNAVKAHRQGGCRWQFLGGSLELFLKKGPDCAKP